METLDTLVNNIHPDISITLYDNGEEQEITALKLVNDINRVTQLLSNLQHNNEVSTYIGVCSSNCYEWILLDLACIKLNYILVAFPENYTFESLRADMQSLGCRYLFSDKSYKTEGFTNIDIKTINLSNHSIFQKHIPPSTTPLIIEQDCYTLAFSSGSTGNPKAIKISNRGAMFLVQRYTDFFNITQNDKTILFMPFSSFQQRFLVYLALYTGIKLVLCDPADFYHILRTKQPTFISCPPLIYETLKNKHINSLPSYKRTILTLFLNKKLLKPLTNNFFPLKSFFLQDFKKTFGSELRFAFVGMAPSSQSIHDFFEISSIALLEMYGLNEAGLIASNTVTNRRKSSVGKEFEEGSVHLSYDGEILIKKRYPLSIGYLNNSTNNASTFEKKLIYTGDIGEIDKDGYIFIKGRKKNIMVSNTGKKFHPENIEMDIIDQHEQIIDCAIIKNKVNKLVCIILISKQANTHELQKYVMSRLNAKYSGTIDYAKALPNTSTAAYRTRNLKLDRNVLREYLHE